MSIILDISTMFKIGIFPYPRYRGRQMFNYNPLWETLRKKEISTYRLIQMGIDSHTLDSLKHNRNVTVGTLDRLCSMLNCSVSDVVEITPDQIR